jgi:uncharacterized protein YndB with AHSA1/START domain
MNEPKATDKASRILKITRVFPASRERVFKAFTDPDLVAQWWGPEGFETPREKVTLELQPGGRHHKMMVLTSAEIAAGMGSQVGAEFPDFAEVVEVVAPELLVLTAPAQPEMGLVEQTLTRIEFHEEVGGKTRLVLIDGPYAEMMAKYADMGWNQSLDKLERMLTA